VAVRLEHARRLEELNPLLLDAAFAAAIALPASAVMVRAVGPGAFPFIAMITAPLIGRRRRPLVSYVAQFAGLMAAGVIVPPVAEFVLCFLAVLIGAYSTGRYGPSWRTSLGTVLISLSPAVVVTSLHGNPLNALWFLQLLFAWAAGFSVRRQLGRDASPVPSAPASPAAAPLSRATTLAGLTPREAEVLHLLVRGHSNCEMAQLLHIGEGTVKTHVARILSKLGVRDRVQAIVHAYETGMIAPGSDDRPPTVKSALRQTR
jgi:DNA-binding CsgD family transcriptional regulator